MKEFSITEVRRRFSELVERASKGERIGITKYGVLVAVLQPATEADRHAVSSELEAKRRTSKKLRG